MKQQILNSIILALGLVQAMPATLAADSNKLLLLADSTSGTPIGMTLHRSSRWQLPSCGALKAPEAPKSAKEEVEEEFATPASVEAAAKKAASARKAGRAATMTAIAQPATNTNKVDATAAVIASVVKAVAPSRESPTVRLTITPGEKETEEEQPAPAKRPRVIPTTSTASAPLPGRNNNPVRVPVIAPVPAAVPSTNQMPAFNARPANAGAPVPGGGSPENPAVRSPGKTAAKGNNQA